MSKMIELFIKKYNIRSYVGEEIEIFRYGMFLMVSIISTSVSILILSALLFDLKFGVEFILIFSFLRCISGGYHAKTYLRCYFLSILLFVFILTLSKINLIIWFYMPLYVASCAYIIFNTPILHQNKQYLQKDKKLYKLKITIVLLLITILLVSLYYFNISSMYINCILYTTMLDAILMKKGVEKYA